MLAQTNVLQCSWPERKTISTTGLGEKLNQHEKCPDVFPSHFMSTTTALLILRHLLLVDKKKKENITPPSQKESVSHHTIPQQSRNLQRPPGELCCVTALHSRALTPSFQWCVCEADQSKHRGPNMSLLTKSKMAAITVQGGEKKTNPKSFKVLCLSPDFRHSKILQCLTHQEA